MSKETAKLVGNTDKGSGKAQNYHNYLNKPASHKQGVTKFEGCVEKLKGFIDDAINYKKADLYRRTTNKIADRVGWNYTMVPNLRRNSEDGDPHFYSTATPG